MYLTNLSRIDLLRLLPKGGEIAEIGVAEGTFSQLILSNVLPERLHLIDPWEHQVREDYQADGYGNPSAAEHGNRFESVSEMFSKEIGDGRIVLHRTYSTVAAKDFTPEQFDWIYIDGLHSREGVSADLADFHDKVKPEGFMLGHDYTNHSPAQQAGFGVVEAVNDFIVNSGYHFLLMTMENFPTYVLTRTPESRHSLDLIARVLYYASWVVELRDYPQRSQFQHNAITVGGKTVVYPSF